MTETNKQLIVVLGMHRSGTSLITRGLQVMGVELGDKFLPPQSDNVTGFWEDVDINSLNIEMLNFLDSDWHFFKPVREVDVELLRKGNYIQRADALLQKKTSTFDIFGFKDPRVAKLLPFWKDVFLMGGYKMKYILSLRHPLSVCTSLEKRHGFDFEKSSLLWLEHIINSLSGVLGENYLVVDYDLLVQSPDTELNRIAKKFELQVDQNALENFEAEFLDKELQHTKFKHHDLMFDERMLPLIREVYSTLFSVAKDNLRLDDVIFIEKIKQWEIEFSRLIPVLNYVDRLNSQISEQEAQVQTLIIQLNEIKLSKAWKLIVFLRKIRLWVIQKEIFREQLVKK